MEVSERTVARDLDALEAAGVPVERARGRQGGVSIPRGWSRLGVGLTAAEVAPVAALLPPRAGDAPLATALGKIVAGLPAAQRLLAEEARQRLLVDPSPWWAEPAPEEVVEALRTAVGAGRRVRVRYRQGERETNRDLDPLALAAKADRWHLVALPADAAPGTEPRVFRCDRVVYVEVLDLPAVRPPDFDLPSFWRAWCRAFLAGRPSFRARLTLTPRGRALLAAMRPAGERPGIAADALVEVDFEREDIALGQLAALGEEARVLDPPGLVDRLRRVGRHWAEGAP